MGRENKYWLGWALLLSQSPSSLRKIYYYYKSLKEAWFGSFFDFQKAGIKDDVTNHIIGSRDEIDLDWELGMLLKKKIELVTFDSPDYPVLLKEIYDPPLMLFCRGKIELLNSPCIAAVGTRKISNYGKSVTPLIINQLCQAGLTVVSGLALGVDALVHQSALEAGGKTIAVLGSGVDDWSIYPYTNRSLANDIIKKEGLVISEYPPNSPALQHHFPLRNRIISGISLGTLVIEAAQKSGALITAHSALSQNREVFAVPGSLLSPASAGTNQLIKMGAKLVSSVKDILDELNIGQTIAFQENKKILPQTQEETIILNLLTSDPIHIDEVIKSSQLSSNKVNAVLTFLEMKGLVKNVGGMNYMRIK